jgi:hypothetical protein
MSGLAPAEAAKARAPYRGRKLRELCAGGRRVPRSDDDRDADALDPRDSFRLLSLAKQRH